MQARRGAALMALFLSFARIPCAGAADAALIAAARKEGSVTWYTTLIVDQFVRPLVAAFEKKYGINVNYVRLDPDEIALRVMGEGAAHRMQADLFDGFSEVVPLANKGLVLDWLPDEVSAWPKAYYAADKSWVATNLYVLTPGYNTELVPPGAAPKTFQDLLNPKWKGKMAWSSNPSVSGAPGFIGLVLTTMGQDRGMAYLKQLAAQNIAGVQASAREVLNQAIAGEYAIALQIFDYHASISAAQGAHVDWIKMQPALAALGVASITNAAPHPAAAKLLLDFLVSDEGQRIFRDADYIPVAPNVPPKQASWRPDGVAFKAVYLTPAQITDSIPVWSKIYDRYFR
jgi:ABC-type Fe3+ transport system substrate-binding protein